MGYRLRREGQDLDEFDKKVIERVMQMPCKSFFFTLNKIIDEHDIPPKSIHAAEEGAAMFADLVWAFAADLDGKYGYMAASMFLNAFMGLMSIELVDHAMRSDIMQEAEDILKEE